MIVGFSKIDRASLGQQAVWIFPARVFAEMLAAVQILGSETPLMACSGGSSISCMWFPAPLMPIVMARPAWPFHEVMARDKEPARSEG